MGSLNRTIPLVFFSLINIVCITCPPTISDIESCKKDIAYEFNDGHALDDFLHAFLNIKYKTVLWNKNININEQIFWGYRKLRKPAVAYYFELYYTGQDLDLPTIPTPKEFCKAEFGDEENQCTRNIEAIGCKANVSGNICFKHMFIHWKKTIDPNTIPGTENLSDEELFHAVAKGRDSLSDVSEKNLLDRLSDETLLEELYNDNEDRREFLNHLMYLRNRYESQLVYTADYRGNWSLNDNYDKACMEYNTREKQDLYDARFRIYGYGSLSYEDLFNEYRRRQSEPKAFDKYYATHISNILNYHHEIFEVDNIFKSREDYCIKYLEQQSNLLNLYNFNMLYI